MDIQLVGWVLGLYLYSLLGKREAGTLCIVDDSLLHFPDSIYQVELFFGLITKLQT